MSRIGKQPIALPDGVTVDVEGQTVNVKGPKGELSRVISDEVSASVEDDTLLVHRPDDSRHTRSVQGLVRSLLANMVEGVAEGFTRELQINGVGYRAEQHGDFVRFELGFSHPVLFELPETVDIEIEDQTELKLTSPDKELLGQVAAKIRDLRPPEPYKGKGIKYKEEHVRRKVGKAGGA